MSGHTSTGHRERPCGGPGVAPVPLGTHTLEHSHPEGQMGRAEPKGQCRVRGQTQCLSCLMRTLCGARVPDPQPRLRVEAREGVPGGRADLG